jgi:hypothetical protein
MRTVESSGMTRGLLVAATLLLYALHQDFWFWRDARPLVFGFLPIGLAYHALYAVAASLLLWALVRWAWPAHLETVQAEVRPSSEGPRDRPPSA